YDEARHRSSGAREAQPRCGPQCVADAARSPGRRGRPRPGRERGDPRGRNSRPQGRAPRRETQGPSRRDEEVGPRGLADAGRMTFDAKAFIAEQVEGIRKSVAGKAIIACSGGVDSTTAAVLASHALGDRLLAVYVDTGLMRKDETEDVARTVKELKVNHRSLRAADEFFAALRGVSDPEKRSEERRVGREC